MGTSCFNLATALGTSCFNLSTSLGTSCFNLSTQLGTSCFNFQLGWAPANFNFQLGWAPAVLIFQHGWAPAVLIFQRQRPRPRPPSHHPGPRGGGAAAAQRRPRAPPRPLIEYPRAPPFVDSALPWRATHTLPAQRRPGLRRAGRCPCCVPRRCGAPGLGHGGARPPSPPSPPGAAPPQGRTAAAGPQDALLLRGAGGTGAWMVAWAK